jgi:hypothetical protein
LSQNGRRDTVVVKPKSASALGIFVVKAENGQGGLHEVLNRHFDNEEEVLLEEFIDHNHSPSLQGAREPADDYKHLYFGKQIISSDEGRMEYVSSQIPFDSSTVNIDSRDLAKIQEVHEVLGKSLIQDKDIAGVAGFDAVTSINDDGKVQSLKITELNLHLPSSLAVYAAIRKVFPNGFSGIAHNMNVPLRKDETADQFMRQHNNILIPRKHIYGMFPLNLSYNDKVDVVVFAKDAAHLQELLGGIRP